MSFKAKDLHYDKQEPAFLRKLRGEYGGDRHNVSVARPSKARLELGEDEGPTIVDEAGENLTKEEYEAMQREDGSDPQDSKKAEEGDDTKGPGNTKTSETAEQQHPKQERVAGIGASNKRKQARFVGEVDEAGIADQDQPSAPVSSKKDTGSKSKSKKKKIKLSFDEDGG